MYWTLDPAHSYLLNHSKKVSLPLGKGEKKPSIDGAMKRLHQSRMRKAQRLHSALTRNVELKVFDAVSLMETMPPAFFTLALIDDTAKGEKETSDPHLIQKLKDARLRRAKMKQPPHPHFAPFPRPSGTAVLPVAGIPVKSTPSPRTSLALELPVLARAAASFPLPDRPSSAFSTCQK